MGISVQLPEDVETRLQNLAALTGRSKSYFVAKAVLENLDELEDLYLVEHELESIRDGVSLPLTLAERSHRYWAVRP